MCDVGNKLLIAQAYRMPVKRICQEKFSGLKDLPVFQDVLFVTGKFGNAGWILNEMNIKGRPVARRKIAASK
jgi:hypothetical protein